MQQIYARGTALNIRGTATLAALAKHPKCPPTLANAIQQGDVPNEQTLAEALRAADGCSVLVAVLLAFDPRIEVHGASDIAELGNYLHQRGNLSSGALDKLTLNLKAELTVLTDELVAGHPPVVVLVLARWKSGRIRIVVGGWGAAPRVALDGPRAGGEEYALQAATSASADTRATATYRQEKAVSFLQNIL